jgi:DNA-binding NarL/FixJ family response regulator
MPFESARTALVEGLVLRRLRRRADARRALEESLAGFASVGAALWAARAEAELARTGARRHSDAELSGTERRVAGLAVRGLTNREIAGEVFLTEKSVEDVLRRVYRAIGVRNRTELAARFSDTD